MECPNILKNNRDCNCTYSSCSRHGLCCECVRYHRKMGQLPACYFSEEAEKTYDRSVEYYLKTKS